MDLSESLYANNFTFALRVGKSASLSGEVKSLDDGEADALLSYFFRVPDPFFAACRC